MKQLFTFTFLTLSFVFYQVSLIGQEHQSKYNEILKKHFSENEPGAVVLVAVGDSIVYRNAIGLADINSHISLRTDHAFRIGSLTKQFTAMAILKLINEGKLSLHDPIQKFIPDFAIKERPITVEHLLNHTSGMQNQNDIQEWEKYALDENANLDRTIDLIKSNLLNFAPGDAYDYSNLGYIVLTYIIEEVSQQSYAEFIDSNFLTPLNMTNSYYGDNSGSVEYVAVGHSIVEDKYQDAELLNMNLPQGAGGLNSSIEDLFIWNRAVFESSMFDQYIGDAHKATTLNNGHISQYGYGWQLGFIKGHKAVRHDGIINGFTSYQVYLPEEQAYAVILTNCDCTTAIAELGSKLIAEAIDDSFDQEAVVLSKEELKKFKGVFVSEDGNEQIINMQDGTLYFYAKGGRKTKLIPTSNSDFRLAGALSIVSFQKNDLGEMAVFDYKTLDGTTLWEKKNDIHAFHSIDMEMDELLRYCGEYEFPNAFTLTVVFEENKLYGTVGNDRKTLSPFGEDMFFANENDIVLKFNNENEKIIGVTLVQNQEMSAKKIN